MQLYHSHLDGAKVAFIEYLTQWTSLMISVLSGIQTTVS